MVSVSGAASDRSSSQPQESASTSYDMSGRMTANRPSNYPAGPVGTSRQSVWEPAQAYSRQGQQQMNAGFVQNPQAVWPPGALPYMQPQVFMYPGLPGNPPSFYSAQSLHGPQRPMSQMVPQVGMVMPPQQYSGVNPMFPYGVAPSPTPEQWLQARNLRPQAAMFQGARPMGWGGVPFQSPANDPRWQSILKPAASLQTQRSARPSQQQQQPPPPPPRTASLPQLTQLNRQMSQAGINQPASESQPANRSSSLSAIPRSAVLTEMQDQQPSTSDASDAAQPALGKVPCAFFLKTGTCAYGDK